MATLVWA
ncbi:hypothetical protein E2C01_092344 [Portunus trituberculatus]|nr:hypothetical protein [Portunus trituberculatus]